MPLRHDAHPCWEVAAARQPIEQLNQSNLAMAFRGELVEQDPADEPASALLERIWAGRHSGNGTVKKAERHRT
jgi:type I restriction enzyme, S subunit